MTFPQQKLFKMIELEPVSKYQKENCARAAKEKAKHRQVFESNQKQLSAEEVRVSNECVQNEIYEDRQFEDSQLTRFIYEKIMVIKIAMNFLAITSILLSILQSFFTISITWQDGILAYHSVATLSLVILILLKYFKSIQLREYQLIRMKKQNQIAKCIKSVIFEIIIVFFHPNLLTKSVFLMTEEPIYGQTIPLELNSVFEMIMLSRIYLFYSTIISASIYSTTRANRICRIYNTKNQEIFSFKSFFNHYPLQSLLVLQVTLLLVYSQMLRLSEKTNPQFDNFGNAIWCIVITMGTIGYGDYYPTTYLGRIVAFFAAISGIIMASLLILTLSKYLTMSSAQNKSHITLQRLQLRNLLQKYAQATVNETSTMIRFRGQSKGAIQQLKKKTAKVKLTIRRIKNMVDTDNLDEEMNRLFETLYQNLMEVYLQQKEYATQLEKLLANEKQNIQETRFSFASQIENIIRDR